MEVEKTNSHDTESKDTNDKSQANVAWCQSHHLTSNPSSGDLF